MKDYFNKFLIKHWKNHIKNTIKLCDGKLKIYCYSIQLRKEKSHLYKLIIMDNTKGLAFPIIINNKDIVKKLKSIMKKNKLGFWELK
jgi:hypothetical protein